MRRLLSVLTTFYLIVQIFCAPQSASAVFETLSVEMPDGVRLNVHYQDDVSEDGPEGVDPSEVLSLMQKAYALLVEDLGYGDWSGERIDEIQLYLTHAGVEEDLTGNAFQSSAMGLSPRFMVLDNQNDPGKTPVIFMPKDYREFLRRWWRINGRGVEVPEDVRTELAGSIMHEMTHAVLYGYHENLGSTLSGDARGDWYTEGLARYYETKIGSHSGFIDKGFRRLAQNKMRFSRGGANYYLKYHDENIFSLRYENALFWFYFEKSFGHEAVVDITRSLADLPYDVQPRDYMKVFQSVTGYPFYRILVDYHNWVYREEYRSYDEGDELLSPSKVISVWEGRSRRPWSEMSLDDIQPLTFQIHRIVMESRWVPQRIKVRSTGFSEHVCVYVYLKCPDKTIVREYHATVDEMIEIDDLPKTIESVDMVFSNLDDRHALRYELEIL